MLEAVELTKTYGSVVALDGLSLTVRPGEIVSLLGANGAGKTTTINLFLGFIEPSAGRALVNEIDVHRAPMESKRSLAYIPEQVALYPALTGVENLEFFASLSGITVGKASFYEFLAAVGIDRATADRPAGTYSKGMRQKVGIAIALAKEARTLLLDEPLSGLDPKAANEFVQILRSMRERGAAVLMATHDIFRSKEVSTRIGIMKSGCLVDELDPARLRRDELEAVYLRHMHDGDRADARASA